MPVRFTAGLFSKGLSDILDLLELETNRNSIYAHPYLDLAREYGFQDKELLNRLQKQFDAAMAKAKSSGKKIDATYK